MKALLATVLFTAPFALAQSSPPPLVSTSGTAQVRVVPDLADLNFEVEVRHADLAIARKEQAERMAKLLTALRAAGVAENELQTSQVAIAPDYTNRREETDKVKFYSVSQTVCCTLHEVKKVPDVTASAISAGATTVSGACLRTSQLRKYRDEARAMAIKAAREKAVALAGELGAKVGKPYTITEGAANDWRSSGYNRNNLQVQSNAANDAAETPGDGSSPAFAPGSISISASVDVAFLLE